MEYRIYLVDPHVEDPIKFECVAFDEDDAIDKALDEYGDIDILSCEVIG